MRSLLKDFEQHEQGPVTIWTDSQSAMALTGISKFSNRSKHIDIRCHYIKDLVKEGMVKLAYCTSEDNVADLLTKPLGAVRISTLRQRARLWTCPESRRSVLYD